MNDITAMIYFKGLLLQTMQNTHWRVVLIQNLRKMQMVIYVNKP